MVQRFSLGHLAAQASTQRKSLACPAPNPLVLVGVLTEVNTMSAAAIVSVCGEGEVTAAGPRDNNIQTGLVHRKFAEIAVVPSVARWDHDRDLGPGNDQRSLPW